MLNIDWIQFCQVITVLLLVSLTCYITISISKHTSPIYGRSPEPVSKILPLLSAQLTVEDYEPFHKYEIWRFYRFSQS
ncbi:MAG TPA: hypothetical protein VHY08_25015 [Bacillota bacterium]|nr:hypothetical protein [Bacillota bacterium]